mgnify:FL=1
MLARATHDVYHLPNYASLESRHGDSEAVALYGIDDEGDEFLLPLLLRDLPPELGLPDTWRDAAAPYGYAAPLTTTDNCQAMNEFLRNAVQVARDNGLIAMFLRWHPLWPTPERTCIQGESIVDHGQTVFVDLTEPCEDWQRQSRSELRYSIRRLKKLGFEVVMDDWSMLPEFHRVYHSTMHRVAARNSYYYSLQYFQELRNSWGSYLHIASVVSPAGDVSAAGLFTECHGIVQYHLSGSDEAYLRLAPTKQLLDTVRHWSKERGNRVFHLGGGVDGQKDSLFAFKAAFSKHRSFFKTSRIITHAQRYQQAVSAFQNVQSLSQGDYFPAYRQAA